MKINIFFDRIFDKYHHNIKNTIYCDCGVHISVYGVFMTKRFPTEIGYARGAVLQAKARLDEAFSAYEGAINNYNRILNEQMAEFTIPKAESGSGNRMEKGRVRELVKVVFKTKNSDGLKFLEIKRRAERVGGINLREPTLRQTLYRMRDAGELECYSGSWRQGEALRNKIHEIG